MPNKLTLQECKVALPKHKRNTVLALAFSVFMFIGGYYVGGLYATPVSIPPSFEPPLIQPEAPVVCDGDYQQGYDDALNKAKSIVAGMKCEEAFQKDPFKITGTIISLAGDTFIIELDASSLNPFTEGLIRKTVGLIDSTIIQRRLLKADAEYEKEFLDYTKEMEAYKLLSETNESLLPPDKPDKHNSQILTTEDLQIGQTVLIKTNRNVDENNSFDAEMVELLSEK